MRMNPFEFRFLRRGSCREAVHFLARYTSCHTTDVAEMRAKYRPAQKESSPRSHSLLLPGLRRPKAGHRSILGSGQDVGTLSSIEYTHNPGQVQVSHAPAHFCRDVQLKDRI